MVREHGRFVEAIGSSEVLAEGNGESLPDFYVIDSPCEKVSPNVLASWPAHLRIPYTIPNLLREFPRHILQRLCFQVGGMLEQQAHANFTQR